MKSVGKAILYGFFLWVITLVVAMLLFQVRNSDRVFFESIVPVVLTISTVTFGVLYFRKIDANFIREGWRLGIIWFFENLILDLLVFMWGPMKMSFVNYIKDVGFTYILIITIAVGFGYVTAYENRKRTIS